jgi:YD repeat-containing protein
VGNIISAVKPHKKCPKSVDAQSNQQYSCPHINNVTGIGIRVFIQPRFYRHASTQKGYHSKRLPKRLRRDLILNNLIVFNSLRYLNNADGTRTVTNALGKQSTYHFTQFNGEYKMTQVEGHPSANCAGANKNYTYDANGFMASKTDWANNLTTYVHNNRGQELSRTEAAGTPQARTITTEWHSEFNLPIKISEPERETVMTYDANGRLLSREIKEKM